MLRKVGVARARILGEFGRQVRRAAQASLKYADGPSTPGNPPHAHRTRTVKRTSRSTGKTRTRTVSLLRDLLFYSYDSTSRSVVIGPEKAHTNTVGDNAASALEYGGKSTIINHGKTVDVTIRERPFMRPALRDEQSKLPPMWANSIR